MAEWAAFVQGIVDRAIDHAGTDPRRLRKLVSGLATDSPNDRERILTYLEQLTKSQQLNADARLQLWDKLQAIVARHERFSTADWAMPSEVLSRMRTLEDELEPDTDPQRFAYLFDWHPDLPGVDQTHFEAYSARLNELRAEALGQILALADWDVQIANLSERTKTPGQLGWALAAGGDIEPARVVGWLGQGTGPLFEVASNYVSRRMWLEGPDWLARFLQTPELDGGARQAVLREVPAGNSFWEVLRQSADSTDAETYWRIAQIEVVELRGAREAIVELVARGRAGSAVAVASYALDAAEREAETDASVIEQLDIVGLLDAALKQEPMDGEIGQMTGYYLGELLDHPISTSTSPQVIARFESSSFGCLNTNGRPLCSTKRWPQNQSCSSTS